MDIKSWSVADVEDLTFYWIGIVSKIWSLGKLAAQTARCLEF